MFLSYILGFIRVEIRGLNSEKFLTELSKKNIAIKNLVRLEYNRILLSVDYLQRRKLFAETNKMCYTVNVLKTGGLIGITKLFWHKIGITLGLLCVLCMLIVLNMFVFQVKVYGTQNISTKQITEFLNIQNIGSLTKKTSIDHAQIERLLINQFNLSMCSVTVYGGSLIVNIRESIANDNNM